MSRGGKVADRYSSRSSGRMTAALVLPVSEVGPVKAVLRQEVNR